ncbi:MAG: glycosyltransferase family 2 protein [Thaumarchaeota archaeon]|nr:glycosyltransferase family 2 protein [Nitrososphaerota archaeon]
MQAGSTRIVVAIPACNEERNIAAVIIAAQKHANEVVVCDDGSTDMTAEIAERLGAVLVKHDTHMGYGAALRSGFEKAIQLGADLIVSLDADGQHDPDDIQHLIEPLINRKADIVIASRFLEGQSATPGYRKFGIEVINSVARSKKMGVTDSQSGFRAYTREALLKVLPAEMGMAASTEILLKARESGLRVQEISSRIKYDTNTSKHNPVGHGLDVLFGHVKQLTFRHPLMLYGIPGVILSGIALATGLFLLRLFNAEGYFSIPLALLTVGFGVVGVLLIVVALIVWTMVSLFREGRA